MKFLAYAIPTEKHYRKEGSLQEKRKQALDRKRRAEDVAHEPAVIRPVGAELKLHYDARRDTDGEIYTEKAQPKFSDLEPLLFTGRDI